MLREDQESKRKGARGWFCYVTLSKVLLFSGPVFPKDRLDLDLYAPSCLICPIRGHVALWRETKLQHSTASCHQYLSLSFLTCQGKGSSTPSAWGGSGAPVR